MTFTVQVDHNQYLSEGAGEVDAVVTVTSTEEASGSAGALEVLILDVSGSMQGEKIIAARRAAVTALEQLRDGVSFALIAGASTAEQMYPRGGGVAVVGAHTRAEATEAINALLAAGRTAMGAWLRAAGRLAEGWSAEHPGAPRHAILLTDGINGEQPPVFDAALAEVRGRFTCDCRGVGTDWRVDELRRVADTLLGSVDIVADPAGLADDFRTIIESAMGKATSDLALRLWAPRGARVRLVKQVSPGMLELTDRRTEAGPLRGDYPTGSWGAETREYQVGVTVSPGGVGDEMLAGRVQLVRPSPDGSAPEEVLGQGLIKATWTDEIALSSRISPKVAHYTGQAELAEAIQRGLAARKAGDEPEATARLGRAVALAHESGNENTARLLAKVVDVLDAPSGTIRLRRDVTDEDEMTLDTRSTRTARFRGDQDGDGQEAQA
jgi:hypothetical protein